MKRNLSLILATALTLLVVACGTTEQTPAAQPDSPSASAESINKSLDTMAKNFAKVAANPNLRGQIRDLAAERFDGDTNVLYKTLASETNVRQALAQAHNSGLDIQASNAEALVAIDKLASNIPYFQVAVPVHLDTWDPETYTPLVGFARVDIDDTELETITAYDAQGNAHILDAQVEPDVPVIILGQNERTDDAGDVLPAYSAPETQSILDEAVNEAEVIETLGSRLKVDVRGVYLYKDLEPWTKGAPEVRLIAASRDQDAGSGNVLWYHGHFIDVNDEERWYDPNRWIGHTTSDVGFLWYEDDVNRKDNYGVTIGYKGFASIEAGVEINHSDDEYGERIVAYQDFEGNDPLRYNQGSLIFKVE